jgi:CubicO group peptidase (beta-lactamase class C family)
MKTAILICFAFLFSTYAIAKEPPPLEALKGIDPVVDEALKTFQVPGVAVAVVVGDEVVLAKGYGFRDVEKKLPMAAETQMPIASVTKQFTVAALATLVRQGKLDWDKPSANTCRIFG